MLIVGIHCLRLLLTEILKSVCLSTNFKQHAMPFMHLAEQTKWTNVSCLRKQHDSKA